MSDKSMWWLPLMEPGDPLWFNYPDSDGEPFRFAGICDGGPRDGQPVFDEFIPGDDGTPRGFMEQRSDKPEGEWVRKVSMFVIPVPLGSEPWQEVMDGKWKGTREELVRAWRSLGADVPPEHWLNREIEKVTHA